MLIPRIVRGIPDTAFLSVRNQHSAAIADGLVLRWETSADTPPTGYTFIPGVDVVVNATASALTCCGVSKVAGNSVNVGDYLLCQCFGYHPNVLTNAAALAAATILTGNSVAGEAIAGATADDPAARIGVSIKTGAANRAGIMIRLM